MRFEYYLYPKSGTMKKLGYWLKWLLKNKVKKGPDITIKIIGRIPWRQIK